MLTFVSVVSTMRASSLSLFSRIEAQYVQRTCQKTIHPHRQEHSSQKMARSRNAAETQAALPAAARLPFARDGYKATTL